MSGQQIISLASVYRECAQRFVEHRSRFLELFGVSFVPLFALDFVRFLLNENRATAFFHALVWLAFFSLLGGVQSVLVLRSAQGSSVNVWRAIELVGRRSGVLLTITLVQGVGTVFGAFACVFPGAYFAAASAVAAQVCLSEGCNARTSLQRSRELGRGNYVKIFIVLFVAMLLSLLFGAAESYVDKWVLERENLRISPVLLLPLTHVCLDYAVVTFSSLLMTSIYLHLKHLSAPEGDVASIFA